VTSTTLVISVAAVCAAVLLAVLAGWRRASLAHTSDLRLAHALSRAVGGLVDLDEVYRTTVRMLHERMPGEGVAILRRTPTGHVALVAARGELLIESGYVQSLDDGLLGIAVRTGQTVVADEVRDDPRCVLAPGMERLRSEAVIPIRDRDQLVQAVIDVTSPRPRRFGSTETSLFGTAAAALEGAVTAASLYERLAAQAATDPLTGLPNHRVFHERLAAAITAAVEVGRPLALCVLDLDRFKEINDAEGHQAGDRLLVQVARALAVNVRRGETLARLGGDEFAWILPGADARAAFGAVERARTAVAREIGRSGGTISAGICDLEHAGHADELFQLADGALYWAKAQGRDVSVCYTPQVVQVLSAEERAAQAERRQALKGLRALARAVDARDPLTQHHSERVASLAVALARRLGWPKDAVARLHEAALLHDVGKIGVPDAILLNVGTLDASEFETIKGHAALGAAIAGEVLTPEQTRWVRGHHERIDGTGYPDGLAGAVIVDGARLLALADAWDAMTSDRPYRPAMATEDALEECRRQSGRQFCPVAVAALIEVVCAGRLGEPLAGFASPSWPAAEELDLLLR
jgi:diguanylate cyclase (GGDEF)-like protein/putative nucleotidyltransferase with HDIG domain